VQQALDGNHLKMIAVSVGDQMTFAIHPERAADPKHARNVRTVHVHVQQSHLVAPLGQPQGQVNSHAGFAHPALAAHDQKFVADVLELLLQTSFIFS
jgi:hypothetical protein